jgi:glyoxylase-like metal-dependent hydrolase (beta-lactamase superfamily II)
MSTYPFSDDSISILLKRKFAIVGDLMVNAFGNLYPPFADDESALNTSWKALLNTRCNVFLPAHGRPIHRKKLISSYKNHFLYASKGHS